MSVLWTSLASVGFTAICIFLAWILYRKPIERIPCLPPGEPGYPLVGDTIAYVHAYYHNTMQNYFEKRIKKYGPVFRANIMGQPTVFFDSPNGSKFLFTREDLVQGYWPKSLLTLFGPHGLAGSNGEQHKSLRFLLANHLLGPNVVPRYIEEMQLMANDHVQKFWLGQKDGAVVKVHTLMSNYFFSVVAKQFLNITDMKEIVIFKQLYEDFSAGLMALPIDLPGFAFHRSLQARRQMDDKLKPYVVRRRQELNAGTASPDQDILSIMLTRPDETGCYLREEQIVSTMVEIVFAGWGTSGSTVTTVIRDLSNHPAIYQDLLQEHAEILSRKAEGEPLTKDDLRAMERTWRVVQETQRWMPPVPVIFREAKETFQYKGFTIPKGWKLASCEASVANPDLFKNPGEYNPSRWEQSNGGAPPFSSNQFGGGDRRCPGDEYAKFNILVFMHHLLKNVRWELLGTREDVLWALTPYYTEGMPVKVYRRAGPLG